MLYSTTERATHSCEPAELHLSQHRHDGRHACSRQRSIALDTIVVSCSIIIGSGLAQFASTTFGIAVVSFWANLSESTGTPTIILKSCFAILCKNSTDNWPAIGQRKLIWCEYNRSKLIRWYWFTDSGLTCKKWDFFEIESLRFFTSVYSWDYE